MKTAKPIVLNKRDLQTLKSWANSTTIEARIKERAKIILLAHEGKTNKEIAEYMHTQYPATSIHQLMPGITRQFI